MPNLESTPGVVVSPLLKVWRLVIEILVGAVLFSLIAAVAYGLNILVHRLGTTSTDRVLALTLQHGEYALLLADMILFTVFLWRATRRTLVEL